MAVMNPEKNPLYGFGAKKVDREESGYRPKSEGEKEKTNYLTSFLNKMANLFTNNGKEESTQE